MRVDERMCFIVSNDDRYWRTLDQLEEKACKWWPKEVREKADEISILQTLIKTQDNFISILKLLKRGEPERIFPLLEASAFRPNLFLKHLLVLTDFGSEPLQRVNKDFINIFPEREIEFDTGGAVKTYRFKALPVKGPLTNAKMVISTPEDLESKPCNEDLCEDLIMIVSYGASAVRPSTRAILYKCIISEFFGQHKKEDTEKKERGEYQHHADGLRRAHDVRLLCAQLIRAGVCGFCLFLFFHSVRT